MLDVHGGPLDPAAEYRLDPGTVFSVADGEVFVLARTTFVAGQQRVVGRAVAFGRGESGRIVVTQCRTFTPAPACLPGFGAPGAYGIFHMPGGMAAVGGSVRDESAAPLSAQIVESAGVPFASVSDAAGAYLLPIAAAQERAVSAVDRVADRTGAVTVPATAFDTLVSLDLTLAGVRPQVVDVDPPNHGGAIDKSAVLRVTFSEPLDAAALAGIGASGAGDAVRIVRVSPEGPASISFRHSVEQGGRVLVLTLANPLDGDSIFEIRLTAAITDRQGLSIEAFTSDFSTAGIFRADGLPPGALRVSLPEDDQGTVLPAGEAGYAFVCGGAQLARPGSAVDVTHFTFGDDEPSGIAATVFATGEDGQLDPNTNCATIFPGSVFTERCLNEVAAGEYEQGSFCVAIPNVVAGDRFLIGVEDAFGNRVEIDVGNMRDERTGAEAVGPKGGVVTFPGDTHYEAFIPEGAFDAPVVVQIQSIEPPPVPGENETPGALDLTDFAALTNPDLVDFFELVGALRVTFDPDVEAQIQYDVSVPAPGNASDQDQYIAAQVVNFRGIDELTTVDTAQLDADRCGGDPATCIVKTDPNLFTGLKFGGTFGLYRAEQCIGYVSGFASSGIDGYAATTVAGLVQLKAFLLQTEPTRYVVPIPCNTAVTVEFRTLGDQLIDECSCLSQAHS